MKIIEQFSELIYALQSENDNEDLIDDVKILKLKYLQKDRED